MNSYIIYPNPEGGIHLVMPTGNLPVEEVATKDVPEGVPYKIVEGDELPEDHTFFNAWEADFSNPDGYGIGADAWFAAKAAAEAEEQTEEVSE
jgi:hypothetical protein